MRITPPTNPFHVARVYGVAAPAPVRAGGASVEPVAPIGRADGAPAHKLPTNVDRLVAGIVRGRIDFSDGAPRPSQRSEAIPMYRRPADLNAAATVIHAGRTIDVSA